MGFDAHLRFRRPIRLDELVVLDGSFDEYGGDDLGFFTTEARIRLKCR